MPKIRSNQHVCHRRKLYQELNKVISSSNNKAFKISHKKLDGFFYSVLGVKYPGSAEYVLYALSRKNDIKAEGTFASVKPILYRLELEHENQSVAITSITKKLVCKKEINLENKEFGEFQKNVIQEAEIHKQLHRRISGPVFTTSSKKQKISHLVMPDLGMDIVDFLNNYPTVSFHERIEIIIGCLEQLVSLHKLKLIHRDIKAENFLYNPKTKKVAIIDFGFTVADHSSGVETKSGSPNYVAPEVLLCRKAFKKSDIFSMTAVIALLLRVIKPFDYRKDFFRFFAEGQIYTELLQFDFVEIFSNLDVSFKHQIIIKSLLTRMNSLNPYLRPELDEILEGFYEIKSDLRTYNILYQTLKKAICVAEVDNIKSLFQKYNFKWFDVVHLIARYGAKLSRSDINEILNTQATNSSSRWSLNNADEDGHTPLMLAAYANKIDIVKFLLAEGANPKLKNIANKTAADLTASPEIKNILSKTSLAKVAQTNPSVTNQKYSIFAASQQHQQQCVYKSKSM